MATTTVPPLPPRNIGRSVWAIFAGFLFVVVITTATDFVLHKLHVFPPLGQYTTDKPLLLATFYRVVYGVVGSYMTARLAPSRPMFHALLGGCIGIALGVLGAVITWNRNLGPHWYPISLVTLGLPQSWLGAKLFLRRRPSVS